MEERIKRLEEKMAELEVRIQEQPSIKEIANEMGRRLQYQQYLGHTFSLPEPDQISHDHTKSK